MSPPQTLKERLLTAARSSGTLASIRDSAWRSRRLLVVAWHGVSRTDEHLWDSELYITPEHLRSRLTLLRDGRYNVLPLAEALERLSTGTLPARSVALTFDDGFEDFASEALPLLQEFGMPATLFPTTYYSNARLPVFDSLLDYVLWSGRHQPASEMQLGHLRLALHTDTRGARRQTWRRLNAAAGELGLDARRRDALVSSVANALNLDDAAIRSRGVARILAPEKLGALPHDLVSIQLHTHRHRLPLTRGEFLRELDDNARAIHSARSSSEPLSVMCYPSGSWHDDAFLWMGERGVRWAVTCDPALATADTPRYLIPRFIDTMAQTPLHFESWASGLAAWLPRRRHDRRLVARGGPTARLRNPWNSMREKPSVRSTT